MPARQTREGLKAMVSTATNTIGHDAANGAGYDVLDPA